MSIFNISTRINSIWQSNQLQTLCHHFSRPNARQHKSECLSTLKFGDIVHAHQTKCGFQSNDAVGFATPSAPQASNSHKNVLNTIVNDCAALQLFRIEKPINWNVKPPALCSVRACLVMKLQAACLSLRWAMQNSHFDYTEMFVFAELAQRFVLSDCCVCLLRLYRWTTSLWVSTLVPVLV